MKTFLIILLLTVNIIGFTLIYYLYNQIQLIKKNNNTQLTNITKKFVEEVRVENERLEKHLLNRDEITADHIYPPPIPSAKLQPIKKDGKEIPIEINLAPNIESDKATTSLQGKVLQLYDKGKTAEEIAKQLNCGITEVSLIIKFHENV